MGVHLIAGQHTPDEFGPGMTKPPSHVICENDDFALFRFWPTLCSRNTPLDFILRREEPFLSSSFFFSRVIRLDPQLDYEVTLLVGGLSFPAIFLTLPME